jgi:nitrite reductase (NADH) large subunit
MGISEAEREEDEVLQIVQDRKDAYRKLIVRDGRLVGAILVGDTSAAGTLVQHFDRGDLLPEDPLELLCASSGATDPATRLVCNCHKVNEGRICEAIAQGSDSLEALGTATKAGTGCGSCKGELGQLLSKHSNKVSLPMVATN